jgi:hypothetical protein
MWEFTRLPYAENQNAIVRELDDGLSERFKQLVFIKYLDHVLYNRACAQLVQPQVRQAVGWLVSENNLCITIAWDSDAEPPTLRGGDAKASGLVLLKSTVLSLQKLPLDNLPLQKSSEWHLNSIQTTVNTEYALSAKESEKLSPKPKKGTDKKQCKR